MKKLFIAAMALATIVSCSKDEVDGPTLDSSKKSVQITIANGNGGTRAAGDGFSAGITDGNGGTSAVTCEASELTVLFANANNQILHKLPLTVAASDSHDETTGEYAVGKATEADTYIWHNVPAAITQVAVVRDLKNDKPITMGETTLAEVETGATDWDTNLDRPISEVFLYAQTSLTKQTGTHVTVDGTTYYIWTGSMTVKPKFARVELTQISCTDLGDLNVDGKTETVGLDVMTVNSLVWKTNKKTGYTIDATTIGTMYGSYVKNGNTTDKVIVADDTDATAVWSWNVQPGTFTGMDLDITATAYDYQVADDSIALKVTGLTSTKGSTTADKNELAEGVIYRIPLDFTEGDLTGQEGKCVQVEVEIVDWVVNTVYPVFGN